MPALAKFMAIPPPIVPAPMTPTLPTARGLVSLGMSPTLAAARSAKKMCRWAADCWLVSTWRNNSCSLASPSSNGKVQAASTQSMQRCGASKPRRSSAARLRAAEKMAGSTPVTLSVRSRIFLSGAPSATRVRAKASARSRKLPSSTSSSITPTACASPAGNGTPLVMICSAASGPTSRGSRCVPPPPGSKPNATSGSPTRADGTATR